MIFKDKKLNLGAGNFIIKGYINHDICYHRPEIDVAWDLNHYPYPWAENTFIEIRAFDVLEHLDNIRLVLDELHRILQPNKQLFFRVPSPSSRTVWGDVTHKRPYTDTSFDYFDPSTKLGKQFGFYSIRKWKISEKWLDEYKSYYFRMLKHGN